MCLATAVLAAAIAALTMSLLRYVTRTFLPATRLSASIALCALRSSVDDDDGDDGDDVNASSTRRASSCDAYLTYAVLPAFC